MRNAAYVRSPSAGQDWRRSTASRQWEGEVQALLLWNKECAISGSKQDVIMHHFFSGARNITLQRSCLLYHRLNGIMLTKEYHADFHRIYGYQINTVRQFQEYVDGIYTQISIQAKPKGLEGSETRVNSPQLAEKGQRIMKLRERLEEIKVGLAKDSFAC